MRVDHFCVTAADLTYDRIGFGVNDAGRRFDLRLEVDERMYRLIERHILDPWDLAYAVKKLKKERVARCLRSVLPIRERNFHAENFFGLRSHLYLLKPQQRSHNQARGHQQHDGQRYLRDNEHFADVGFAEYAADAAP